MVPSTIRALARSRHQVPDGKALAFRRALSRSPNETLTVPELRASAYPWQIPKSFRIRTYEKHTRNSFRIRTYAKRRGEGSERLTGILKHPPQGAADVVPLGALPQPTSHGVSCPGWAAREIHQRLVHANHLRRREGRTSGLLLSRAAPECKWQAWRHPSEPWRHPETSEDPSASRRTEGRP